MAMVGRQVVEVGELGPIRDTEGVGVMVTWKGFAPSKMARIGLWTSCCNRQIFKLIPLHHLQFLRKNLLAGSSVQFSSVAQSCPTLCDPMNCSMPGLPVHHQLLELTQTHAHQVDDAIQPSHPLSSPTPPAPNPSQHQGLFQWVNSSHEVAKVLESQLQHQSFQWTPRTDLL